MIDHGSEFVLVAPIPARWVLPWRLQTTRRSSIRSWRSRAVPRNEMTAPYLRICDALNDLVSETPSMVALE